MKVAVKITIGVYKDKSLKEVFIEWTPEKFEKVLKDYIRDFGIENAIPMIKRDIEQEAVLK